MKKCAAWTLVVLTAVFFGFLGGLLFGRSLSTDAVIIQAFAQQHAAVSDKDSTPLSTQEATQDTVLETTDAVIPETEDTSPSNPASIEEGKININTASLAELDTLPGVGPAIAQRIVSYRTEHGPFDSIYEIANVSGIGEKKLSAMLDYITVGE